MKVRKKRGSKVPNSGEVGQVSVFGGGSGRARREIVRSGRPWRP